jgi:hypothetical protein
MSILQDKENPADIYFSMHFSKKSPYVMEFFLFSGCLILYGRFGQVWVLEPEVGRHKSEVERKWIMFGLLTSD